MASSTDKTILDRLAKAEDTIARLTSLLKIDGKVESAAAEPEVTVKSAAAKSETVMSGRPEPVMPSRSVLEMPSITVSKKPSIAATKLSMVYTNTYDGLFADNEKYRVPVQASSDKVDLWSFDNFDAPVKMTIDGVHTIVNGKRCSSSDDGDHVTTLKQAEYNRVFYEKFPYMTHVLSKKITNMVVAGGAAAWPCHRVKDGFHDVDIFIVGIDPDNIKALTDKVVEINNAITTIPGSSMKIRIRKGLIKYKDKKTKFEIQIILRAYSSISSLLHGFDIPASCVAFDGEVTYFTTLGLYASLYLRNIVYPKYRSPTFEKRLCKYSNYGYSIILPGFTGTPVKMARGGYVFEFEHVRFYVKDHTVNGAYNMYDYGLKDEAPGSDYDIRSVASHSQVSIVKAMTYPGKKGYFETPDYGYSYPFGIKQYIDPNVDECADYMYNYCSRRAIHRLPHDIKWWKGDIDVMFVNNLLGPDIGSEFVAIMMRGEYDRAMSMINGAAAAICKTNPFKPEYLWFRLKSDVAYTASCNPLPETYDEWYGMKSGGAAAKP